MNAEAAALLEEHIQALKIGAVLTIAALFIASRLNFFQLPKQRLNEKFPLSYTLGAFIVYLLLSVVIIPAAAVEFLSYVQGSPLNVDDLSVKAESWINIGLIATSALALILYVWRIASTYRQNIMGENAFVSFKKTLNDFFTGAATWFLAFPCALFVSQILAILTLVYFPGPVKEQVAVMYVRLAQSSPVLFLVMASTFVMIVPVVEELLFRGFLQTALRQYLGVPGAIILASAIFAFFHYSSDQGVTNLEIVGSLFVLSCFLGFLFERQRSLWAPIGLHAFFNLVSISFLLFK